MQMLVVGLMLAMNSAVALADNGPNRRLVEQYIRESRAEEISAAQIDGTVQQYSANLPAAAKSKMKQYFSTSVGWAAVNEQYTELIANAFTADELKSAIAYLRTPLGASFTKKYVALSRAMAVVSAANMQRANPQGLDGMSADSTFGEQSIGDLSTAEVEEHKIDGRVYFTGTVENRGKQPARSVQIEVNLFSGGKFVDQYTSYVSGIVAPGATRYFKVNCGCKDSPPAPHDSYKVNIVSGY